ncbi:hypothetical protein AGMMS49975_08530 [Clostridia bacterium]|nr:hypothetical protein AGMMS49975_08530 [Clostridia bacterium]
MYYNEQQEPVNISPHYAEPYLRPSATDATPHPNAVLTFLCALVPGAGHMYLGFIGRGMGIMAAFGLSVMLTVVTGGLFVVLVAVIFFASFFDAFKIRRQILR